MLRNIFAVIAGVVGGFVSIALVQSLGSTTFPDPTGLNTQDIESIRNYFGELPLGALIVILAAWAIGAFISGLIGSIVAKNKKLKTGMVSGVILLLFAVMNVVAIPYPSWFKIVGTLMFIPFAYMGAKSFHRKRKNNADSNAKVIELDEDEISDDGDLDKRQAS